MNLFKQTQLKKTKKITFFDAFSGIGCFRLAAESLGIKCVGFSEIDKNAIKTYCLNFDCKNNIGDITKADTEDICNHDIFVGGFPCQPFSIAGKRLGFADTRGTLYYQILRICKEKKPKAIILENVEGLVTHDGGNTFRTILMTFGGHCNGQKRLCNPYKDAIPYNIYFKSVKSTDWGVPQTRKRVFIIGIRNDIKKIYRFPFRNNDKTPIFNDIKEYKKTYKIVEQKWIDGRIRNSIKYKRAKRTIFKDIMPFPTIMASDSVSDYAVYDNDIKKYRRPTIIEFKRAQGLPDNFKFNVTPNQFIGQIGNGVTVNVAREIFRSVIDVIKNGQDN